MGEAEALKEGVKLGASALRRFEAVLATVPGIGTGLAPSWCDVDSR